MKKAKSGNASLTGPQSVKVTAGLNLLDAVTAAIADAWSDMTPDNKIQFLANSPEIARMLEIAKRLS